MFEIAKIYVRSIVGIVCMSGVVGFGMSIGQVNGEMLTGYFAACIAMVLLDAKEPNAK